MGADESERIADFYAEALRIHGGGPRAVGWTSYHTHLVNHEQLLRTDGLSSGVSVLDVGCGHGALERFLRARGIDVEYTGYDICEPLIDKARELSPHGHFELRDIDVDPPERQFDFVFASGIFSLRVPNHEAWVARMIERMYGLAGRGVAFNMLSGMYAEEFPDHPMYWHADPAGVLASCLTLTRQVAIDHVEQATSFTVYMYRGNAEPVRRLIAALRPGDAFGDAHRAIAEHYVTLGHVDEAFAYLESLAPSAELYEHIAELSWNFRVEGRRVPALERAVELAPDSARVLGRLAIAYLDDERPLDALATLERAHAAAPGDEIIAEQLATLRAALDE